jgi:hypothetical protein
VLILQAFIHPLHCEKPTRNYPGDQNQHLTIIRKNQRFGETNPGLQIVESWLAGFEKG